MPSPTRRPAGEGGPSGGPAGSQLSAEAEPFVSSEGLGVECSVCEEEPAGLPAESTGEADTDAPAEEDSSWS